METLLGKRKVVTWKLGKVELLCLDLHLSSQAMVRQSLVIHSI